MISKGTSDSILTRPQRSRPAVCILLENNPAPFDRRVWQEARALTETGYHVSVICPKGKGLEAGRETIEDIDIYRYPQWEARQPLGYIVEYSWALACEFLLALKVYGRTRFRVIHACNPPDNLFLIGAFFKLFGVRFIFDHHDLCPELFEDKFGKRNGLLYRMVCFFEHLTFRLADVSIATNESYREIALNRGGMSPDRVFVVRSCLDLTKLSRRAPRRELTNGKRYLVVYLGVMGPQDGVHLLLQSIASIVHRDQRRDTEFALIGSGTETPRLRALATEMKLDEFVNFTGRISDEDLDEYLSTADVGVAPDPVNALNDKSTMNKILHYMAYGLPIVQFDLTEGRRSAEDASLYACNNDPEEFASAVNRLLDSESLRKTMGAVGLRRIEERLNWGVEKQHLVQAYATALDPKAGGVSTSRKHASTLSQYRSALPEDSVLPASIDVMPIPNASPKAVKYVIITPARDEESHIEKTMLSVAQQTIRPVQWVIVDDGSRDSTGATIDKYANIHPWITPVHRLNRGFRQAGEGVVNAFYDGYAHIESPDWDFVVKLDADLSFAPDYFERCFAEFTKDARLGICGGGVYHQIGGAFKLETTPAFHVRGATKIYKRECWDHLGGLLRAPGWDTVDEIKANMLGWNTRTVPELQLLHHRVTGAADGSWKDSVKNGRANYVVGYHPIFMSLKCLRRVPTRPLTALGLFWGFLSGYFERAPRVEDRTLINFTRTQQLRRLLLLDSIWR